MKKNVIIIVALLLIAAAAPFLSGCDENDLVRDLTQRGGQGGWETAEGEVILLHLKEAYERYKVTLSDAILLTSRIAHDRNLHTIDRAVELFQLLEGRDPSSIGAHGEAGTLVGEGYLNTNPKIPLGLRQQTGEWSKYMLKNDPLRAWPVGDWDGYRHGEKP